MATRKAPRYDGLRPSSEQASNAAQGASKKSGTRCEVILRRALWRLGARYRICVALPGRPDIVFSRAQLVVFCDGDFWHGRELENRLRKLARGHNGPYWTAKILANVRRDKRNTRELFDAGWTVLRFWESDILAEPDVIAAQVVDALRGLLSRAKPAI